MPIGQGGFAIIGITASTGGPSGSVYCTFANGSQGWLWVSHQAFAPGTQGGNLLGQFIQNGGHPVGTTNPNMLPPGGLGLGGGNGPPQTKGDIFKVGMTPPPPNVTMTIPGGQTISNPGPHIQQTPGAQATMTHAGGQTNTTTPYIHSQQGTINYPSGTVVMTNHAGSSIITYPNGVTVVTPPTHTPAHGIHVLGPNPAGNVIVTGPNGQVYVGHINNMPSWATVPPVGPGYPVAGSAEFVMPVSGGSIDPPDGNPASSGAPTAVTNKPATKPSGWKPGFGQAFNVFGGLSTIINAAADIHQQQQAQQWINQNFTPNEVAGLPGIIVGEGDEFLSPEFAGVVLDALYDYYGVADTNSTFQNWGVPGLMASWDQMHADMAHNNWLSQGGISPFHMQDGMVIPGPVPTINPPSPPLSPFLPPGAFDHLPPIAPPLTFQDIRRSALGLGVPQHPNSGGGISSSNAGGDAG